MLYSSLLKIILEKTNKTWHLQIDCLCYELSCQEAGIEKLWLCFQKNCSVNFFGGCRPHILSKFKRFCSLRSQKYPCGFLVSKDTIKTDFTIKRVTSIMSLKCFHCYLQILIERKLESLV